MSGGDKADTIPTPEQGETNRDHQTAQEQASQGFLADAYDWVRENPGTSTAIGLVALAGVGYLTRGRWMPAISRLLPEAEAAAKVSASRTGAFDASKAGLRSLSELVSPELQGWKTTLGGYTDIGVDAAGTMIYRGAKAGAFAADNVLVVEGAAEAKTLFRAISREGFLQRNVWQKGALGTASELGEVTLPGRTRFIFAEGKVANLESGAKLVDLKNGTFDALSAESAARVYSGL